MNYADVTILKHIMCKICNKNVYNWWFNPCNEHLYPSGKNGEYDESRCGEDNEYCDWCKDHFQYNVCSECYEMVCRHCGIINKSDDSYNIC